MCINPIEIINYNTKEIKTVKCGKCILCRRKKCREWAIRLINESKYYKKMCMVTLTFKPKFLMRPIVKKLKKYHTIKNKEMPCKTIRKVEKYETIISPEYINDVKKTGWLFTFFNKKLRRILDKKEIKYAFYAVGEHGTEKTHRAHWHVILFGVGIEDLEAINIGNSKKRKPIYYSKIIEKAWNYKKMEIGKHTISEVTGATIKYVANYTMKKMYHNGNELYKTTMRFSNQNKIGIKWARRNHKELRKGYLKDDEGQKYAIPKQYYLEMKRFENEITNESMNQTAIIIEQKKDEKIKELLEKGMLSKEELLKKAKKLENRLKLQERSTE